MANRNAKNGIWSANAWRLRMEDGTSGESQPVHIRFTPGAWKAAEGLLDGCLVDAVTAMPTGRTAIVVQYPEDCDESSEDRDDTEICGTLECRSEDGKETAERIVRAEMSGPACRWLARGFFGECSAVTLSFPSGRTGLLILPRDWSATPVVDGASVELVPGMEGASILKLDALLEAGEGIGEKPASAAPAIPIAPAVPAAPLAGKFDRDVQEKVAAAFVDCLKRLASGH